MATHDIHKAVFVAGLLLASSCSGTPAGTRLPKAGATSSGPAGGSIRVAGASPAGLALPASPGVVATADHAGSASAGIVVAASQLVGVVTAPATLISEAGGAVIGNNGAGIISNNGGSIIGNNGAGLRLLALPPVRSLFGLGQVPLAGAKVVLADATGAPVTDASGQPLSAVTDANGRYSFNASLPAHELVASADLGGNHGLVKAIVNLAAPNAQRQADMDLISTLTTSYILDTYVAMQADKVACLDRLPAAVEADTRQKGAAAFATAGLALPTSLAPTVVDADVTKMRGADSTFDQQMETVRKLLILAGQSDLGSGQAATQVNLGYIESKDVGSDGTLYFATSDSRVWRVGADGVLLAIAGNGRFDGGIDENLKRVPFVSKLDGAIASQCAMGVNEIALDDAGNLVLMESSRLSRLAPDGTLTELAEWPEGVIARAIVPRPHGVVDLVVSVSTPSFHYELRQVSGPNAITTPLTSMDATDYGQVGQRPDGSWIVYGMNGAQTAYTFQAFDPTSGKLSTPTGAAATIVESADRRSYSVDLYGHIFTQDPTNGARMIDSTGAVTTVAPAGTTVPFNQPVLAPDGSVLASDQTHIYRLQGGKSTLVAGLVTPASTSADASTFSFQQPAGLAVAANGDAYVADGLRIYRVDTTSHVTPVVGTGNQGSYVPTFPVFGQPGATPAPTAAPLTALGIDLAGPALLRMDPQGDMFIVDGLDQISAMLYQLGATGTFSKVGQLNALIKVDLQIAADGTTYQVPFSGTTVSNPILVTHPDGSTTQLPALQPEPAFASQAGSTCHQPALALDGDGSLLIAAEGKLQRWSAAGGLVGVATDERFNVGMDNMCCDGHGRVYMPSHDLQGGDVLLRYDTAAGKFTALAGLNTPNFAGITVDDDLNAPAKPCLAPDGSLVFLDVGNKQVKRIPAANLPQ